MFDVISSRRLSGNGPHLAWRGEHPGFSRVAAGALDLRRGPQGPALVASGKASPHASGSGASRDSSPVKAGASDLVRVRCRNLRFLSSADMDLGVLLESPRGVSPCLEWGHAHMLSSPAVAAVSRFPSSGSRDRWLSHESFPQGRPTCHRGVRGCSA